MDGQANHGPSHHRRRAYAMQGNVLGTIEILLDQLQDLRGHL